MTQSPSKPAKVEQDLSREAILDGTFLKTVRAAVAKLGRSAQVRTDAQIDALAASAMATRPTTGDIWIFSYGSLMWNPTFRYVERRDAVLQGWHRKFCLRSPIGRGTPEHPCLMLALEQGDRTYGVGFRLPVEEQATELSLVFRREMFGNAYVDRWVTIETGDGSHSAITFVANAKFEGYAGSMTNEEIAAAIVAAKGIGETCVDYFRQTLDHLRELKMEDDGLENVNHLIFGLLAR
jgi:glutathione-specific gamma-glutamylcyclotransferase